jgi:hypothetical protein
MYFTMKANTPKTTASPITTNNIYPNHLNTQPQLIAINAWYNKVNNPYSNTNPMLPIIV